MAFTPITVGESLGLQAAPRDYTNQIIGAQKLRRQEDALKRKEEEEEFAKLADIKIDYSKYHRIDRPRVKQMYASYFNEMHKLYKEGNPNWKNVAYEKGNDLKFAIEQVAVDSKVKFDTEKYVTDPTTKKSKELLDYYNWLNQGDFNNPPKIQPDAYGQITAFDPTTGTIGYVSGKNYNLPTLAEKSVFDPALSGYSTTTEGAVKLPTGETVYKKAGVYNPVMIEGAIGSLAGTPEFNGWRIDNAERIRKYAAANPSLPPQDVMYNLWAEDIMKLEPIKFQETIQKPNAATNIYNYPTPSTEEMAGYGAKPIYVKGFVAEQGKPLQYSDTYTEGNEPKNFFTTTIDGMTLGGQTVKVAGGPYLRRMDDSDKVLSGALDIELGDMAVVPVYKKGTIQTRDGKDIDIGGVVIPDQALDSAKKSGALEYGVVVFGNNGKKTYYGDASSIISNATFLKEDKIDKVSLKRNLDVLTLKAAELNKSIGTAPKEEKKAAAKEINASLIPEKAKAAGYTEKEYRKLLEENGVKIIE